MKLYHATPVEDVESIIEMGIFPTDGGSKAHGEMMSLQGQGLMGIFGFKSIEEAESFAIDNGSEYGIFSFETGDLDTMIDPEYENGESIFVLTDEPITSEFIKMM
jgi:hypothetical protein